MLMKFWKVKRSLLEVKLLDIRFIFFTVKLAIFSFLAMDQSIIPKGYRKGPMRQLNAWVASWGWQDQLSMQPGHLIRKEGPSGSSLL
jgi:hypothetical protein